MISGWHILVVLLLTVINIYGQVFSINDCNKAIEMPGDDLMSEWSSDSKKLLFQSVQGNKNRLYMYLEDADSLISLSDLDVSFRNPEWHPDGDKIVFDTDREGVDYLYVFDLKSKEMQPLFSRNIKCRNASFSSSSRQVYFTGYNELSDSWEIYSYDFVYDNLNPLTDYNLGNSDCDISNDGKQLAYCKDNPFNRTKSIEVINWYGDKIRSFDDFNAQYPSWGPSGFKLYFVSDMDNSEGEIYSIWKDGSHLERLTVDDLEVAYPVVSPDGSKIAVSVFNGNGWDIHILYFDDIGF